MKRIFSTLSQKWPEYILEILVLIIGIYGAFALDSWNEDRLNDKIRDDLQHSLLAEYESNLQQLKIVIDFHQRTKDATSKLLLAIKRKPPIPEDSIKFLMAEMCWTYTFDPQTNAMRAAVSSGQIHLLENTALKNLLFAWTDMALDASEDEKRAKTFYEQEMMPFMGNYIMETDLIHHYFPSAPNHFSSAYASRYQELLQTKQFENLLAIRWEHIEDVLRELKPVYQNNTEIIELLQSPK